MSLQVLVVQPGSPSGQFLINLFRERGDQAWLAADPAQAQVLFEHAPPDLLVIDVHRLAEDWSQTLPALQRQYPQLKVLFTADYPDPLLESKIQTQYDSPAWLRAPFTRANLEEALAALFQELPARETALLSHLPRVRVSMRYKITLPYIILALVVAVAGAYIISRVVLDTVQERFLNQLIEAGKLTNDWMVQEENRLLETLRLLAYTETMPAAVIAGDSERLRQLALPVAVNAQEDAIEILDTGGTSLLSLHHIPGGKLEDYQAERGQTVYRQWSFVRQVLDRQISGGSDKYAGLARAPWGDYFYVAGPLVDDEGNLIGVVLVGRSLSTLVRQVRADTLAHASIYDLHGRLLASSLVLADTRTNSLTPEWVDNILANEDGSSLARPFTLASIAYTEIVGPWTVRKITGGTSAPAKNTIGLLGAALPETFLVNPSQITRWQIFLLTALAFLGVIILGLYLANRITHPLLQVVDASAKVAGGNLDVQVNPGGNDEIAILAYSFNQMVTHLREGSLYRDLLGRTVSPQVREQLRQNFASGQIRLDGQDTLAAVLISGINGFTTLAEAKDSTTILTWLNEYFGEVMPVITGYGGVVSKLEGDAMVAFFGILPSPLPVQEGAYQACQAALAMVSAIEALNTRRTSRGEPPLTTGIGVNTGPVTAGALGTADRLHYTIIGDTVNTTSRLQEFTWQLGQVTSAVVSQHTLFALGERRHEFDLAPMGLHTIKGKAEQVLVYRLQPTGVPYGQFDTDVRQPARP